MNGRSYRFVRFKGVEDESLLERQLGNVIVEGLKLYVNLPHYGRMGGGQPKTEEKRQVLGNRKRQRNRTIFKEA